MPPPKENLGRYRAEVDGSSCEISEPKSAFVFLLLPWVALWDFGVVSALVGANVTWTNWPEPPVRWLVWSPFPIVALVTTAWVTDRLFVRRSWVLGHGRIDRRTRIPIVNVDRRRSYPVRTLQLLREMWRSGRGCTDKLRFFSDVAEKPIELFRAYSRAQSGAAEEIRALAAIAERWTRCELHEVQTQVRDPDVLPSSD